MRSIIALLIFSILHGAPLTAGAQTPVINVVSDYSPSPTGTNYTLGGSSYFFGNQSGTMANIQNVVSFSLPDGSYYYNVFVDGKIKIRRVNNPVVSGRRCLVWVEAVETSNTYRVLLPYVDSMELFFNGQTLNKGTDNLFGNQGDGAGNNNNIERVDWVVQGGLSAAVPAHSGFPIFERGADNAHDPFCIAAITSINASGDALSYGPIVRVAATDYGNMANSDLNWSILRKEEAEPRLYRTTSGVQRRGGVFISFRDLGIASGQTIYGYSLFAHDLPASATPANLLNFSNPTFFPTNTSSNTTLGGIDLIAIAGLYNIAEGVVLPVTCTNWNVSKKGSSAALSWKLANEEQAHSVEIQKSGDNKSWQPIAVIHPNTNTYSDHLPRSGDVFYRLKMFSRDGRITYSTVKKLSPNAEPMIVSLVPYRNTIAVTWEGFDKTGLSLAIYNTSGSICGQFGLPAGTGGGAMIPISLPPGLYIVEFKDRKNTVAKKVWIPIL